MLSNDFHFDMSNSLVRNANVDLNFDEFIQNCQIISHESSLDASRDMSDIDEFFIKRISE